MKECPNCENEQFSMIVEAVQFGFVNEYDDGKLFFEGDELGTIQGKAHDPEEVLCGNCLQAYELRDDELYSISDSERVDWHSEDTVEVPKDALMTVMRFAREDSALDFPPEFSDVPDAFEEVEQHLPDEYTPRFASCSSSRSL